MSDEPHPSEPLLTQFTHDGFRSEIPARLTPMLRMSHQVQGAALLLFLPMAAFALTLPTDGQVVMALMMAILQVVPTVLYANAFLGTARVQVEVDASNLTLHRSTESGRSSAEVVPMASIEAAYVVEPNPQHGVQRRLRIARRDGDLFVPVHNVPESSAAWLANQISRIAREAKARAVGEATPELLALLDQGTRAEAQRKLQLQRQSTRSP